METLALTPALVVDDDPAMRRRLAGLLRKLDSEADIAEAASVAEALDVLSGRSCAMAIVDVGLPDGSGCDVVAWLHRHQPQTAALVISAWGHEELVLAALHAGAIGYLLKERDDLELMLALKSIQRGGAPIDPTVARGILAMLPAPGAEVIASAGVSLTAREHEVLILVGRGCSNREIATLTGLSPLTIEGYTKAVYRKLAVGSRTAAVFEAQRLGLLR